MKRVLIIGSSSKISQELYKKYVDNNYEVITTYCNNKIYKDSIYMDVKDENSVIKAFDEISKKYDNIDIMINAFGYSMDDEIENKSLEDFKKVIDINLTGVFLTCKYVKKYMNKGCIINISSTNSIDTYYPLSIDYDAAKAGVNSLTKNFAKAYAPHIRVNAVLPGWVDTNMNIDMDPKFKQTEEDKILLKRFATPAEIANVIYFLSTDEASYINSSLIRVDGGYKN